MENAPQKIEIGRKLIVGVRHFLVYAGKGPRGFTVCHYAGDVIYDAENFLAKNKDLLYQVRRSAQPY